MSDTESRRPTIAELEKMLNDSEREWPGESIEILPNGEIRRRDGTPTDVKPLTLRENLGGEYAN